MANRECNVPDDIIFHHILPNLPAKSVIRFKCVCKSWLYHTRTSDFIKLHLRQSIEYRESILLTSEGIQWRFGYTDSYTIHKLETPSLRPTTLPSPPPLPMQRDNNIYVVGSCNGLLLIGLYEYDKFGKKVQLRYCLWNPLITNELRRLLFDEIIDPKKKWWLLNFGYDETNDDEYKFIILSLGFGLHAGLECVVYRLRANSWKLVLLPVTLSSYYKMVNGAHRGGSVNNCLHFLLGHKIIRFHLSNEVWDDKLDIYPDVQLDRGLPYTEMKLDIYKGMLSMELQLCKPPLEDRFNCNEFWVMKEYGVKKSWTKLFHIWPHVYIGRVLYSKERDRPLLAGYKGRCVAWYNGPEDVEEIEIEIEKGRCVQAHRFVPSLVQV